MSRIFSRATYPTLRTVNIYPAADAWFANRADRDRVIVGGRSFIATFVRLRTFIALNCNIANKHSHAVNTD